jgi:Na+/melibiose symporter-like transporter
LRLAYSAGHFAKSAAWYLTDLLLAYYVHVRVGLSAQDTGVLLFSSMVVGAALDLVAAFLLRRAEGHRRRILTIQLVAGLATAGALLAIFTPLRTHAHPFAPLAATLAIFRVAYAFYDVAQNGLVSLLPDTPENARLYVVWRQALSALARIGVACLALLLLNGARAGHERLAAAGIAVLIALTSAWLFGLAARPGPHDGMPSAKWVALPCGFIRLLLGGAALAGPLSLAARMVPFVASHSQSHHNGATLLFAFVLGTLVGPLVLPLLPRGHLVGTTIFCTLLTVMAAVVFLAEPRSGLVAAAACLAHGVGLGALTTLFWADMSGAIRRHAERTGVRTDLTALAVLTATTKLSGGLFGLALGLLLEGFKAGDPATMTALVAITGAGGLGFLLSRAPRAPSGASTRY